MGVASRKRARKAGGVHQRRKRLKKTLPNKLRVPKANLNQAPPELTAAWDHSKTMKQNYEAMGLSYDPNMRRPKRRTDNSTSNLSQHPHVSFTRQKQKKKEPPQQKLGAALNTRVLTRFICLWSFSMGV